ncbi:Secreted protein [Halomonas sp. NYA30]
MWKKIVVAAMAWYLPTLAVAVEPTPGTNAEQGAEHALPNSSEMTSQIKGLLDGELREWFILSHGNDSNASFIESGDDHITIDITGFADDEAWETQEALSISLTINEGELISAVVLHPLGDSTSPPLYTSEGGDVEVTLTHYERASQRVHVAGTIQGVLALQIQLDEPPSQEETIEIDVAFDVEAQKIEF